MRQSSIYFAGVDLNRRWNNPDIYYHPTVYHTKQLILRIKKVQTNFLSYPLSPLIDPSTVHQCTSSSFTSPPVLTLLHISLFSIHLKLRAVGLIVDIHGHSLKQGAFFYGCSPEKRLLRLRSCSPPLSISPVTTRAGGQRDRRDNIRDTEGPATATSSNSSAIDIQEEHISTPELGIHLEGSIAVAPIRSTDSTILGVIDIDSSSKDKDVIISSMAVAEGLLDSNPIIHSNKSLTNVGTSASDDRQSGDQAAVVVTALYPSTPRGLQLPSKKSSLRDLLSWRVHLFPRICTALAPLFAAESCRYASSLLENF